ncbi:MAG: holo-ACP synthase [Candidatus Heimdallarchaeota archaeon]|nr:MAG: holo-ACP synthase [Candidatus Heimdallarchaeota archaeon]
MSHWSIGIDITDIKRFREYPLSRHSRFYDRVFNEYEFRYCTDHSDPYPHFAGIFAAKEAVFKAVGKFFPLSLFQISIHHDEKGRPTVWLEKNDKIPQLENKSQKNFENLVVQVSITHSSALAMAWALAFLKTSQNDTLEGLDRLKGELQREICNEFVEHRCTS